jgi:hypothetical protein
VIAVKLAEALILRADCQKRMMQLQQRLIRSAKVQEGEQPPENPQELMRELEAVATELMDLIQRINRTNSITEIERKTLSDALAERDVLKQKWNSYNGLINTASIRQDRYSRSEVKFISTVDIAEIQRIIDNLARDYRELDSKIQGMNWQTELIEA